MFNYRSSFNGLIEEIKYIRVDNFESDVVPRAYFLSHCHTDHIVGMIDRVGTTLLTKLKNKDPPTYIYMSEPSAVIITNDGVRNVPSGITEYIRTLDLGNNVVHLPEDRSKNYEEKYIDVTVLPAGHCLGSVMFLFKTDKTILYTGDIRISISDLSKFSSLHDDNNDVIPIDVVYVDITFYDDKHQEFPSRKESVECIIDLIDDWLQENRDHKVCLQFHAKYGYEFVFNEIYDKLNRKTYVPPWKWEVYRRLSYIQSLTNDFKASIQVCKNVNINKPKCSCTENLNYLQIYITAYQWDNYNKDRIFFERERRERVRVCFSTHCSKNEVDYFISYLNPGKAVGFVKGKNKELTVKRNHDLQMYKTIVSPVKIESPPKKREKKICSDVIKKVFEF